MAPYEINTIEEFCHRINGLGELCNLKELMKVTSPSVFDCRIHIKGDGYNSSFPLQDARNRWPSDCGLSVVRFCRSVP